MQVELTALIVVWPTPRRTGSALHQGAKAVALGQGVFNVGAEDLWLRLHIASALKSAAVTVGTVLWIDTAAAAALPLFQTGSAASSRPRGCLLREP